VETAAIISDQVGMAPQQLDGLIERDFGIMEGRSHFGDVKVPALFKPIYLVLAGALISLTGEKRASFKRRLFETGCYIASQHPDQKVLAVVHTAVQSHLIAVLVDKKPNAWMKYNNWSPCSITEIEISPEGAGRLVRFNANEHITLA
jgi:broad specificity phosphatase PhoE